MVTNVARAQAIDALTDLLAFVIHQAMTNCPPERDYLRDEVERVVDQIITASGG